MALNDNDHALHYVTESPEEIVANWTPELIANSIPIKLPEYKELAQEPQSEVTTYGAPQILLEPEIPEMSIKGSLVPNTQIWPYTTIGRVLGYWIDPATNNKYSAHGSCWVIAGTGNRLVITAGHSLYDFYGQHWPKQTWLINYAFYGVDNSIMPITKVAAHRGWANEGRFPYDIGAAVLARGLIGCGNLGVAYNIAPNDSGPWTHVGYPQENPMSQVTGTYGGGGGDGHQIAMTNDDLGYGASGGPWLINFQGKPGYVNGLMSTQGAGTPYMGSKAIALAGSPYFGKATIDFIQWAMNNML